jgi:hypothetical protein
LNKNQAPRFILGQKWPPALFPEFVKSGGFGFKDRFHGLEVLSNGAPVALIVALGKSQALQLT